MQTFPNGGEQTSFCWLGPVTTEQSQMLQANGIKTVAPADTDGKQAVLSTAWLYVAPAHTRGHAIHLAEALAAGMPCVVVDEPEHRALVRNGALAVIYSGATAAAQSISNLLLDAPQRAAVGSAARLSMLSWRTRLAFEQRVVPIYAEPADTRPQDHLAEHRIAGHI